MANFAPKPNNQKPNFSGKPQQQPLKKPSAPSRFSGQVSKAPSPGKGSNFAPRQFDREDKPIGPPPPKKPPMKPAPSQQTPAKRMMAGGSGNAKQFSGKPQAGGHQAFSQKPGETSKKPMTGKPKAVVPPPPVKSAKTIVPPKSFKAQFMPKGALIAIIIIIVIVALGAVGYFFFREQVLSTYEEVAIAVGIKDKPEEEIVVEEVTPAPTPVPIATLEDVVFTEKSDPSTGTDIASGSTITYTLTLHNKSDGDLSGLAVTDEIPKNTEELTILSTPGGSNDNSNDTMVDISNIELPGGDNQVIRFQVKAGKDLEDGTEISNTATLTKNGSRKISNNNSASVLTVSTQIAMETTSEETTVTEEETTTTTTTEEETTTTTTTEEETTPQPTPTATPAPTPTPTATPVPTATPAPTVTPAPTATPVPTATPTTTPAPEEADDEASPEDMTTVETGGEALNLMIIFASLAAIAGFALVLMRRSLVREK